MAAGGADKNRGETHKRGFPLDTEKDLIDFDHRRVWDDMGL